MILMKILVLVMTMIGMMTNDNIIDDENDIIIGNDQLMTILVLKNINVNNDDSNINQ